MSASINASAPARIPSAVAGVLGVAGLITMIISSTMSSANTLFGLPMLAVQAAAGVVLVGLLFAGPQSWRGNHLLSLLSIVASIALFTAVVGNVINSRILLISGLFSYNAGNTVGWSVFYVTVASLGCFLAAVLALIISAFTKSGK